MTDSPNGVNISDSFDFRLLISKLMQERQIGPGISAPGSIGVNIGSHIAGNNQQYLRSKIVGRPVIVARRLERSSFQRPRP